MPEVLQYLYKCALNLPFGKIEEDSFFNLVRAYSMCIYEIIILKNLQNPKKKFEKFLYMLGQNRLLIRDSRTFLIGKQGIIKTIVDLQKEVE